MIPLKWISKSVKLIEAENKMAFISDWEKGKNEAMLFREFAVT